MTLQWVYCKLVSGIEPASNVGGGGVTDGAGFHIQLAVDDSCVHSYLRAASHNSGYSRFTFVFFFFRRYFNDPSQRLHNDCYGASMLHKIFSTTNAAMRCKIWIFV